jgi:phage baseplate assembly protein W
VPTLHPAIPLGVPRPWQTPEQELIQRITLILQTRPGEIPWRPDFGCDLEGFLGAQASDGTLARAKWEVQQALSRWMEDTPVADVRVTSKRISGSRDRFRQAEIPTAERALVGTGVTAVLRIDVDLETDAGILTVQAVVEG